MSVETLRAAIQARAGELLGQELLSRGVSVHKKGWRDCPCSWCDLKREATVVIGHIPRGVFRTGVLVEDARHIYRDQKRVEYRAKLKAFEAL